jgi:hypothetical protein
MQASASSYSLDLTAELRFGLLADSSMFSLLANSLRPLTSNRNRAENAR